MKKFSFVLAAAAVTIAAVSRPTAAIAEPAQSSGARALPDATMPADKTAKSPPNFAAMFVFMDKLFPPQPDPDPVRLALARTSAEAMWPSGVYGQMMSSFVGSTLDRMMQLKTSDLAPLSGNAQKRAAGGETKDLSVREQVAGKDSHFDQRLAAMRGAVNEEMEKISAVIDPRMREGLARAMARRFDARQLGEINIFFGSPTGRSFAAQYMQLWVDPDTIRSIFSSVPELMKLVPELSQKLKAANDKFPRAPTTPAAAKQR